MSKYSKTLSLSSRSLRNKLNIAFSLMAVLPFLVCIYLVSNYILPKFGFKIDVTLSVLISLFTAVIGFVVIKEIFDRILTITSEAKLIAAGDFSRKINMPATDEMNDLGLALNKMTSNLRSNMEEIKQYSEKSSVINIGIQKRVLTLSSLLEISSLITHGTKLEEILKFSLDKSRLLGDSDVAFLLYRDEGQETFYMKAAEGINSNNLLKIKIDPEDSLFIKIAKTNKPFILDKENTVHQSLKAAFYEKFKLQNMLAQPVFYKGKITAILGIGNAKEDFYYKKDDIELLDTFAKQVSIALGNELLMQRINKLEIKDALTGLYNKTFILNYLQDEIQRAITYQRPCAFLLLNIDNFLNFYKAFGAIQAESVLKRVASIIKESVSEIDRVARIEDNEFAIVLPEQNKRKAKELAEEIRKKIEFTFSEEQDALRKLTLSGGIGENPLDGIKAEELINKARETLRLAKTQGKNRIVS